MLESWIIQNKRTLSFRSWNRIDDTDIFRDALKFKTLGEAASVALDFECVRLLQDVIDEDVEFESAIWS